VVRANAKVMTGGYSTPVLQTTQLGRTVGTVGSKDHRLNICVCVGYAVSYMLWTDTYKTTIIMCCVNYVHLTPRHIIKPLRVYHLLCSFCLLEVLEVLGDNRRQSVPATTRTHPTAPLKRVISAIPALLIMVGRMVSHRLAASTPQQWYRAACSRRIARVGRGPVSMRIRRRCSTPHRWRRRRQLHSRTTVRCLRWRCFRPPASR
jgi:hypothetical protein